MKSHNNILDYWRTSCIDGDRMSPKDEAFRDAQNITTEQISSGQVTETVFAALVEQIDKERRTKFQKADRVEEPIPVLIVPLTLRANARGGRVDSRYRTTIRPLCLPAILQADGKLTPPQHEQPWIDRQLLEPNEQDSITLGHIDSVDTFLSQQQRPQSEQGWEAYWAYAAAMFQAVIGDKIQTFQLEGYTRTSGCLIPLSVLQGSRRHVIPVYERLQGQKLPALLQRFVAGSPAEISNWLTPAQQYTVASRHTGQMTDAFSLSPSQRESLHHVLHMSESDILAINGPPGTGKTTLIQSIVATLWVNAALEGGEPPIIVAASTNNQAVQNVIASFGLATDGQAPVVKRWLPEVNSFGLYCVSDSKRMDEKTARFQYVTPAFKGALGGSFAALNNLEYLERAIPAFLSHVAIHFNRAVSLDESVTLLQQELQDTTRNLSRGIAILAELTSLRERVLQERASSAVTIASIQEQLDTARSDQRQHQHITGLWRGLVKRDNWLKAFFDYLPPVKRNLHAA